MGLKAMKVLYKMIIILFLISLSTVVYAEAVWDGSVSIARYGYLPQTGMYAASNAFPKNTKITVTNPETGRSVDVTVLERLEDNSLFLVLSSEAAEIMGINYGSVFHGSISEQVVEGLEGGTELPFNPDPDVNPSAGLVENPELTLIQDYINNELGGTNPSLIIPDTAVEPDVPEAVSGELVNQDTDIIQDASVEDEEIPVEIVMPEQTEPSTPKSPEVTEPAETLEVKEIPEPEIIETPIPETVVAETGSPQAELIETPVPETPLVENMPLEEVYNKDPEEILLVPDLTEILREKEEAAAVSAEEDIPEAVYSGAVDPPVRISENFAMDSSIPSLPVKEVDLPVITTMPDAREPEVVEGDIAVSFLPELPIIGIEAIVEDEVPVAVSMNGDVVFMEESPEITTILPELIITEITKDTPLVEELTAGEPDAESAEKDELIPPLPEPAAAEIAEKTTAPENGAPRVDELAVQEPEPEEELSVSSIIPEIVVPAEETLPVSPLPELGIPKDGVEIVLEPSEYRPPVVVENKIPVPETEEPGADKESEVITPEIDIPPSPEPAEALDRKNFNITRELLKDSYYLQLGAYREEYSALDLAGQLEGIYPVTVYVLESRDVLSYKVMVGPLGLDESGVILYNFKSMGYEDAFLRKGL